MHSLFRPALAVVLLAATASSAFAATTPLTGPAPAGSPTTTVNSGETTSPGDPYVPDRPEPRRGNTVFWIDRTPSGASIPDPGYAPGESAFEVSCSGSKGKVMVKNTGDVTIPAGTWFAVNYPVNQIKHFQTSNDVPPGWATGINLQAAEGEDFVCGAWVWQDAPPPELAGGVVP